MYRRLVILGLCLSFLGKTNGEPNDDLMIHQKSRHHLHQYEHATDHKREEKSVYHHVSGKHHKGFKTRNQGNESACYSYICADEHLATVVCWLNGTKELDILYNLLLSCDGGCGKNTTMSVDTNNTSLNVTFPIPGLAFPAFPPTNNISFPPIRSELHNASLQYPLFVHLARYFGGFLSGEVSVTKLLATFPELAIIWKEIVSVLGGSDKTDFLTGKLRGLLGCSGNFATNLLNVTNWEHYLFNNN